MLLDMCADNSAAHDVACAIGELVEVAGHGHCAALREGRRRHDAGDDQDEKTLALATHGVVGHPWPGQLPVIMSRRESVPHSACMRSPAECKPTRASGGTLIPCGRTSRNRTACRGNFRMRRRCRSCRQTRD